MGLGLMKIIASTVIIKAFGMNFASLDSMMEVGASSTVFKEHFGEIEIQVEVPLEVHNELTGMLLDHAQAIEGMRTEVKQLEILKVGKNLTGSSARKLAKEKEAKILISRWVNTQKTPLWQDAVWSFEILRQELSLHLDQEFMHQLLH